MFFICVEASLRYLYINIGLPTKFFLKLFLFNYGMIVKFVIFYVTLQNFRPNDNIFCFYTIRKINNKKNDFLRSPAVLKVWKNFWIHKNSCVFCVIFFCVQNTTFFNVNWLPQGLFKNVVRFILITKKITFLLTFDIKSFLTSMAILSKITISWILVRSDDNDLSVFIDVNKLLIVLLNK